MMRKLIRWALVLCMTLSAALPCQAKNYVEGLSDWPVMTLRGAVERGLRQNFDLRTQALNPAIAERNLAVEEARFDITVDAAASTEGIRRPDGSSFPDDSGRGYLAEAGLSKEFEAGLDARLAMLTSRNAGASTLDPEYRSALVLDLTQPLLRDFGSSVNTADVRIAATERRQASLGYLDQAQRIAEEIEIGYYDLSQAIEVYRYRIESRRLAEELLEGNREKLEVGIIPLSELQEAETAVADRDEQVLLARQQVETVANGLKDLLGIMQDYPLSRNFYRTEKLAGTDQGFPELEAALSQALKDRPDLEARRLEVANTEVRLEFDRNQLLPRLDLEATLGVNGLAGDGEGVSQRDYFDSFDRMAGADGYEWFAGLRFSYPLDNRAAEAGFERSGLEKRQAIYGVKRLETTVETEVIGALIRVKRSLERVEVAGRFETLADSTLAQEMERLAEGLSDTFRILDFQDDVIDARIRRITALSDFNRGLAGIYRAMGGNLERLGLVARTFDEELIHEQ